MSALGELVEHYEWEADNKYGWPDASNPIEGIKSAIGSALRAACDADRQCSDPNMDHGTAIRQAARRDALIWMVTELLPGQRFQTILDEVRFETARVAS